MEENIKNYFTIIPSKVRYDKDLSPNAKLLYGEILALCNDKGYCWASNRYWAELYNVSNRTVSKWIDELSKKEYIKVLINYKECTKMIDRCIKICGKIIDKDYIEYGCKKYKKEKFVPNDRNFIENPKDMFWDPIRDGDSDEVF